ncbi:MULTISPECIES: hypothetical protein [unclassified Moraxella]|uniref:hypothetical protein n=1 Tax=unclassified Moraxella TaxID=2685852 RepID=UPI003AF8C486
MIAKTSFRQWGMILPSVLGLGLMACQPPQSDKVNTTTDTKTASQPIVQASPSQPTLNPHEAIASVATSTKPNTTQATQPRAIDWQALDSGVKAVDKASFNYPFKLDSEPVKAYAEAYHVDPQTARYQLTVGMASNEVLSKLLDQLGTDYVSHQLTGGKDAKLVILTNQNIIPSQSVYIFGEPYAKGLSLPVAVQQAK